MEEPDFRPLEFRKTTHAALRPPIFDGDFTRGDDYAAGALLSMQVAKKALLISVRFTAGPDAAACGWGPEESGVVEFLMAEQSGRYVGMIHRQEPGGFCSLGMDRMTFLDGLGHGPGGGGRKCATFFARRWMSGVGRSVDLVVGIYIGKGWFGGWKEIVVRVPKKDLYVARP